MIIFNHRNHTHFQIPRLQFINHYLLLLDFLLKNRMEQEQQCGFVSVDKIIQTLTGELSQLALAQVKDVYHQLVAKSTNGVLTPNIVIANYDAANHPEVRFGQMKTAQEVFQEFASSFDFTDVEKKDNDGLDPVITWESFYQYCCNLYWSCEYEAYFRVILESVFHEH